MSKIYTVIMRRGGEDEAHQYLIGAFTNLAKAYIEGIEHRNFRGGKYYPFIQELTVDDINGTILEVSRDTAFQFAKMCYPEKFDDRGQLKEV